jgi:hypothetical protein
MNVISWFFIGHRSINNIFFNEDIYSFSLINSTFSYWTNDYLLLYMYDIFNAVYNVHGEPHKWDAYRKCNNFFSSICIDFSHKQSAANLQ